MSHCGRRTAHCRAGNARDGCSGVARKLPGSCMQGSCFSDAQEVIQELRQPRYSELCRACCGLCKGMASYKVEVAS